MGQDIWNLVNLISSALTVKEYNQNITLVWKRSKLYFFLKSSLYVKIIGCQVIYCWQYKLNISVLPGLILSPDWLVQTNSISPPNTELSLDNFKAGQNIFTAGYETIKFIFHILSETFMNLEKYEWIEEVNQFLTCGVFPVSDDWCA